MLAIKIRFFGQYVDSFPLNYMLKFENTPPILKNYFFLNLMEAPNFLHLSSYDMQI